MPYFQLECAKMKALHSAHNNFKLKMTSHNQMHMLMTPWAKL